jgi:hypothetical protein
MRNELQQRLVDRYPTWFSIGGDPTPLTALSANMHWPSGLRGGIRRIHRDPSTTKLYDRRGYNPEKAGVSLPRIEGRLLHP